MKLFTALIFVLAASALSAQTASLKADNNKLAPSGGVVHFVASTAYAGQPGALGWTIDLPAGWALVSVAGPNLPAIAPNSDASGALEFAFTSIPSERAEFSVAVRYPAGLPSATVSATVYVRIDGKLTTISPEKVDFRRELSPPKDRQAN